MGITYFLEFLSDLFLAFTITINYSFTMYFGETHFEGFRT